MTQTQKVLIGTIVFVVVGFLLVFLGLLPGLKLARPDAFTLEVWGFADDDAIWKQIIKPFTAEYGHITVKYRQFDEDGYESMLLNRLAENTGPDVFMLKNSRMRKHRDKIYPLPQSTFKISINTFDSTFVDVAHGDLVDKTGAIIGFPIYIDSLALFYNKDIFNVAGITAPPKTWDEVVQDVKTLTTISSAGDVARSGIALGSGKNVAHAFEIISALMLQNGDEIITKTGTLSLTEKSQQALTFYAAFADRTKQTFTWSNLLPNSIDAFAEEKTAMMIGFARDIEIIRGKNPHLNLGIAPFPQLTNTAKPTTYGDYAVFTVSKLSEHPVAAWNFIIKSTGTDNSTLFVEKTGRAPSRRDVLSTQAPPLERELFWRQALTAKSWPVPDYDASKKIFLEVIDSVSLRSANSVQAFNRLREQLRLLLP